MPVAPERTPLAGRPAAAATALLVVDMFSGWDFPDAEKLAPAALRIAPRIAALKRRCDRARVPTVFINDNDGRWRSDAPKVVERSAAATPHGAAIAARLAPGENDYFVLKPKHSAFFATPLDLLLRHLRVRRLLVTGVAGDQCVLLTAIEARMQDYAVVVPADCVGSQTSRRNDAALRYLKTAHKVATPPSRGVRLVAPR
jgi:nicotinamidase-related amidase